jgi:F-type H+-transporting ATPase subunit delta
MAINRNANRFAQSLFFVAEQKDKVFEIQTSLEQLVNLYKKNAEFRFILLSKRIEKNQKSKILRDSLTGKINMNALEILEFLLNNDSIKYLPLILNRYQLILSEKTESAHVSITVSNKLNEQEKIDLQQSIEAKLDKKIDIQLDVDASLIGGMVLRIDNTIIDGSIRRRLDKIREHLVLN